jgi:hypothetical protein
MDRRSVRVVTYAWGRQYLDRLLDYALASLLAPGNLPALAEAFDCTFVIVTEEALFRHVEAHPLVQRAKAICPLRLISLDDLIGEPWQYGMSLAYALFRGFADLGPAMTETYMLFLNADFILADGCYERLIPHMLRGDSVLLSPSYCTVEEAVIPLLEQCRKEQGGILALPPRRLARMIIDHRHNTIRAKTINQSRVHFEYMDQVYWQVDESTFLAHQMPISMVALRPEQALRDINTFWDWGITYEFCPSRQLTVLGDSDEFLMLELRGEATHRDLVQSGPTTPRAAASRLHGYITQYQIDNARFPLTLHADDLPRELDEPRANLHAFFHEMLQHLPARVPDHRYHTQWLYHRWHLSRHMTIKPLRTQIAALEAEHEKECTMVGKMRNEVVPTILAGSLGPRFTAVCDQLTNSDSVEAAGCGIKKGEQDSEVLREIAGEYMRKMTALEGRFDRLANESAIRFEAAAAPLRGRLQAIEDTRLLVLGDLGYCGLLPATQPPAGGLLSRLRKYLLDTAMRTYVWRFGSIPHTRPTHPLHFIYKEVTPALDAAALAGLRILVVGEKDGIAARWADPAGRQHLRLSAESLLTGVLDTMNTSIEFGLCIVELDLLSFARAHQLHQVLAGHLDEDGKILMYWINKSCEPYENLQTALASCALIARAGAVVRFFSSPSGWGRLGTALFGEQGGRSRSLARRALPLLYGMVGMGREPLIASTSPGQNCWGTLIEIGVRDAPGTLTQIAPAPSASRSLAAPNTAAVH